MATIASGTKVETYLGAKAESLLGFKSPQISKERENTDGKQSRLSHRGLLVRRYRTASIEREGL